MPSCAIKRGIFVLRDCSGTATSTCPVCSRSVCSEHIITSGPGVICVDCNARRKQEIGEQDWYDRRGPFAYRNRFYSTYNYHPFYGAYYYDSYYDNYDVRAFDKRLEEPLEDEGSEASFLDS